MKLITKIKLNDFREQTDDMTSVTIGYWKKNLHNGSESPPISFAVGGVVHWNRTRP